MSKDDLISKSATERHLDRSLSNQADFFWKRNLNLLIFAEHCAGSTCESIHRYNICGQNPTLSKEFHRNKSFECGIQAARYAAAAASYHAKIGDDWHSYINVDWGAGISAGYITGKEDVLFERYTNYSSGPVIDDWDDLGTLKLDLDNFWIECVRRFWWGVSSEYSVTGVAVQPIMFRSPLDYANDLRGNALFLDMYENPEEVESLIEYCARCIMTIDGHLRDEIPLLRTVPGGVWGACFGNNTIFLNGDPVDLISEEMGRRFNNPFVESLASAGKALYFHHHSIGVKRAALVSSISGLSLQEILQDPNGPLLVDMIDDEMIEASLRTPIYLDVELGQYDHWEAILERISTGRFIASLPPRRTDDYEFIIDNEYRKMLETARGYQRRVYDGRWA